MIEIVYIFMTSAIMGAFNLAFFLYGVHVGKKKSQEDGVTVTKENQDFIKQLMEWRNYEN